MAFNFEMQDADWTAADYRQVIDSGLADLARGDTPTWLLTVVRIPELVPGHPQAIPERRRCTDGSRLRGDDRPLLRTLHIGRPVGNGLSSVTAGRRLLVVAAPNTVLLALKPGWLTPCVPIDATNTPKPARSTVPFAPGVHATPKRGLK